MKNITTIERIAMQKTAIKKTAMQKKAMQKTTIAKTTAKITTTALLFFLALFTLTTNLKAQAVQENSKSGFFAGFVVLDGFQVDSTKSITTSPFFPSVAELQTNPAEFVAFCGDLWWRPRICCYFISSRK